MSFASRIFLTQCVRIAHNVCMIKTINRPSRSMVRSNCRFAGELWGSEIGPRQLQALRDVTERFGLSVGRGGIQLLNGNWFVTNAGLLRLATQRRCLGIRVQAVREYCDQAANRWVFRAVVCKSHRSKGFVGYGDADPTNTSSLARGAEMRVAETRAVNRALRKAYGIGLCSVEELVSHHPPFRLCTREKRPAHRTATVLPTASPDCGTSSAS